MRLLAVVGMHQVEEAAVLQLAHLALERARQRRRNEADQPVGLVHHDDVGSFLRHQPVHALGPLALGLGAHLARHVVTDADDRDHAPIRPEIDFAMRVDDLCLGVGPARMRAGNGTANACGWRWRCIPAGARRRRRRSATAASCCPAAARGRIRESCTCPATRSAAHRRATAANSRNSPRARPARTAAVRSAAVPAAKARSRSVRSGRPPRAPPRSFREAGMIGPRPLINACRHGTPPAG